MREGTIKLSDIAALAGVSKSTASRALAHSPLVSDETRERVEAAARRYNYRPNSMAQAMARRRSGLIGFCLYNKSRPFYGHTFFGPVLDGILSKASELNYHVVLAATDSPQNIFEEHFIEDSIDGAVLGSNYPQRLIDVFRARQIPLVVINDALPSEHNGFVIDDNYGGARAVMRHLVCERGYESVAFISDRLSHPSYLNRYLAYLDALKEYGLAPYSDDGLPRYPLLGDVLEYNPCITAAHGYDGIPVIGTPIVLQAVTAQAAIEGIQPLLARPRLPRAIFCAADSIAIGVITALRARGIRVPEDVAVSGYDDIPGAATAFPPLTTVRVNRDGIGREAVKLLKKYIDDPLRPSETVCLKNELIVREST